jgi:DNA-binding NarL/FixJ family response regulator
MIRVAVVDDHPLFRSGVIQTLQAAPLLEVVGQGACAQDAIRIGRDQRPDVMVLDMNMPDRCDGIGAVDRILADSPHVRILVLTVVADSDVVRAAMRRGVSGYILKGIGGAEFVEAVRAVHRGEGYVSPTLAALLLARAVPPMQPANDSLAPARLSEREGQILGLIAKGFSNKEIGLQLELSDKTVKHYVTNLFQKLGVRNRTEAAIRAARVQQEIDLPAGERQPARSWHAT